MALVLGFDLFSTQSEAVSLAFSFCHHSGLPERICQKLVSCINDFFLTPEILGFTDRLILGAALRHVWQTDPKDFGELPSEGQTWEAARAAFILSRVARTRKVTPEELLERLGKRLFKTRSVSLTGFAIEREVQKNIGPLIRSRPKAHQRRREKRSFWIFFGPTGADQGQVPFPGVRGRQSGESRLPRTG